MKLETYLKIRIWLDDFYFFSKLFLLSAINIMICLAVYEFFAHGGDWSGVFFAVRDHIIEAIQNFKDSKPMQFRDLFKF